MSTYKKIEEKILKIKDSISGYDKEIIKKIFRLPNGIIENYFIDKNNDSVQIFALTADDEVLLVRQFRAGNEKMNLELPGGGLEEGEDVKEAAARELLEETGYEGIIQPLTKMSYTPYSTGFRHCFVAYDCVKTDTLDLDDNEFLSVVKMPLTEFLKELKSGYIRGTDCAYIGLHHLGMLTYSG